MGTIATAPVLASTCREAAASIARRDCRSSSSEAATMSRRRRDAAVERCPLRTRWVTVISSADSRASRRRRRRCGRGWSTPGAIMPRRWPLRSNMGSPPRLRQFREMLAPERVAASTSAGCACGEEQRRIADPPRAPLLLPTRSFAPGGGRCCGYSERALSRAALGGLDCSACREDCAQVLRGETRTGALTRDTTLGGSDGRY